MSTSCIQRKFDDQESLLLKEDETDKKGYDLHNERPAQRLRTWLDIRLNHLKLKSYSVFFSHQHSSALEVDMLYITDQSTSLISNANLNDSSLCVAYNYCAQNTVPGLYLGEGFQNFSYIPRSYSSNILTLVFPWRSASQQVGGMRVALLVENNGLAHEAAKNQIHELCFLLPNIMEQMIRFDVYKVGQTKKAVRVKLTKRERVVLKTINHGHSLATTAEILSISVNTVAAHCKNIYRKLQVKSSTQAGLKARKLGLLD